MKVEGITWHAITLEESAFEATKRFYMTTLELIPMMEMDGIAVFQMANGTLLELYTPATVPPYGYNGSLSFGFRVDDVVTASAEIEAAGGELLGEIIRVLDMGYAYRHFRAPDGRIYGLNEQK